MSSTIATTTTRRPDDAPAALESTGALNCLLAEFDTPTDLMHACEAVRDAGYRKWDAHSPFPIHGIERAAGIRPTILPWIVFLGGAAGTLGGLLLQWWTNAVDYPFLVSGKPFFSLPANIPIIFETTVLAAAITAVVGMLVLNNLPLFYNALFTSQRFARVTTDKFFVTVQADDPRFKLSDTRKLLESVGATAVEEVHDVHTPPMPGWITTASVFIGLALLIPPAIIAKARVSHSAKPAIHIIQDMDNQTRFKAQQANPDFADGRAMRPEVPGTLARGDLALDTHFFDGTVGGEFATTFPTQRMTFDRATLERGQQRFNIYCAPCHGVDGAGNGMVNVRATELEEPQWVPPLSMYSQQVRERPDGHIYNTIKNGIRTMPAYGDQIAPADRWAIVAYVRALQRAQAATVEEVPEQYRGELR